MSPAKPLRGRNVVDFSQYVPGPYCTRILTDLGADVIKIEPVTGDPVRDFMPGLYDVLNGGKKILPLDLKEAAGLDVCDRILRQADVVVEGFRPGVADRLGIGYRAVSAISSTVVYCSLSGYGQDGPRASHAGHDLNYSALAGGFAVQLAVGDCPQAGPFAAADLGGAMFAATSICASLAAERDCSVHLDVSLTEASLALAAVGWGSVMTGQPLRERDIGSRAPGYGMFCCADGHWIAVGAVEDAFWDDLCALLGISDLAEPPFDTHSQRMLHRTELAQRLGEALRHHRRNELLDKTAVLGLPVSPVHTIDDVVADGHFQHRGAIRRLDGGFAVDHPVRFDGQRPRRQRDHEPIDGLSRLPSMTGLSDETVADLVETGVVGYVPTRIGGGSNVLGI